MEKTYLPPQDSLEKSWYVIDATNQRLGRLASEIAMILTGKKRTQKLYRRHSGRPGGMKTETFAKLQARIPERIIEHAVKGMLPKSSLGKSLFTKLKVYAGDSHPHEAQKPQALTIQTIPGGDN